MRRGRRKAKGGKRGRREQEEEDEDPHEKKNQWGAAVTFVIRIRFARSRVP